MAVSVLPVAAQNSAYEFTHLAGSTGGAGYANGPIDTARFNIPIDLAFAADGTAYVADYLNGVVRKISPGGIVSTLAGSPGQFEVLDGTGAGARFGFVACVKMTASGDLLVGDGTSLRRVTRDGVVTTVFTSTAYPFFAFTADAAGTVYVADSGANVIRKITASGEVSVLAGTPGQAGAQDGIGAAARFNYPRGIDLAPGGNLLVLDSGNTLVRTVSPTGEVHTLAGNAVPDPANWYADGTGAAARFFAPRSGVADAQGNLYVLDQQVGIRKVTPAGVVTTLFTAVAYPVLADAYTIGFDPAGSGLYVLAADSTIWRFPFDGTGVKWAGVPLEKGTADGIGDAARFRAPQYVTLAPSGDLFVSDSSACTTRKITAGGVVSTIAGTAESSGHVDGPALSAQFVAPAGLALDQAGNLFIADPVDGTIRKLTPAGVVSTFAGQAADRRVIDGPAGTARLGRPTALAIDAHANLYVSDSSGWGSCIRRVTPEGTISTLAGTPTDADWLDGTGAAARFSRIIGLTVVPSGDLYVAESYFGTIRKVTPQGVVTTVPGCTPSDHPFTVPQGIAAGADGNFYVTDYYSVRKLTPTGTVTLLAGNESSSGSADGVGGSVAFNGPYGVAVAPDGTLYVADVGNACIRKGVLVVPAVSWAAPAAIFARTALSATQLNATANLPGTFTYAPAAGTVLPSGDHTLRVTFTPTDTVNFAPVTKTVTLTVCPAIYAGDYFGTIGSNGGSWALHVNRDNTGLFIAYSKTRGSAIVSAVTVAADGTFTLSGNEAVATGTGGTYSLSATADTGRISGQFGGTGDSLSGAIDLGSASGSSGSYRAAALNLDRGTAYAIIGPGGQAMMVFTVAGAIETAKGTVDANGRLTTSTASGANVTLAVNAAAGSVAMTLTKAGTGQRLEFVGLADGVASTTRPMNMSARAYCGTGNSVTIGGFVVTGGAPKRVLIRAVGPTLTTQGIGQTEALLDPMVEVHHGAAIVAQNDNWGDNANAADITSVGAQVGATSLAATDSKSAAVLTTLDPGVYTFVVRGKNDSSGIVLLEAYDADSTSTGAAFVNIAARAYATTGNGVAIGGFVISGNAPKKILMRAVGPTLTTQSIGQNEVLADPMIELHRGAATLATNDDWGTNANQAEIVTTGARIGATPLAATDTRSSALLMTLSPGIYTFIAKGKTDTSGIVLVEVYDAD